MANTYLTRTTSTPTNDKIMTFSFWLKKEIEQVPIMSRHIDSNNRFQFYNLDSTSKIQLYQQVGGSVEMNLSHPRALRDFNGWYHWVIAIDTTQATDSNRVKIYINGELLSGYSTATYPAQNADILFNGSSVVQEIGRTNGNDYYRGSMSHFHFIDGTQYAASDFGSTDSTTGEWKINTSPNVTYGNNGFFILKDGNSVTDQSGNSNNFTVGGGTLTKTEDNPSNVFCTLNPLNLQAGTKPVLQYGNTSIAGSTDGGVFFNGTSTLGMTSGKFYCEFKLTSASNNYPIFGITGNPGEDARNNRYMGYDATSYGYYGSNGNKYNNNSSTSWATSWNAQNDIVGCAVDLDNLKIYFHKNGTWQDSGDPTSGSTGTGSPFTLTAPSLTPAGAYFFGTSDGSSSYASVGDFNFGNGYFGTTAVASAGSNASGIGIFEYDVPTGYTALSTKGLNL